MRIWSLIVTIAALAALSSGALAEGNALGVFFSDTDFTDATTNTDVDGGPIDMYLVVLDCGFASVYSYECGLEFSGPNLPTVLGLSFPAGSGGVNYGENDLDFLVNFWDAPQVAVGGAVVLATLTVQYTELSQVQVVLGPASVETIPGFPAIANGIDPDDIVSCTLTGGWEIPGLVATINGTGVTPVERSSLSAVRNLFH